MKFKQGDHLRIKKGKRIDSFYDDYNNLDGKNRSIFIVYNECPWNNLKNRPQNSDCNCKEDNVIPVLEFRPKCTTALATHRMYITKVYGHFTEAELDENFELDEDDIFDNTQISL